MKTTFLVQTLNPTSVTTTGTVTDIVDLTSAGGVAIVAKITPNSAVGATVQAQWSNDKVNWVTVGSPTTCTSAINFGYFQDRPAFRYVQLIFAISSGSLTTAIAANVNRDIP